ncbi:MAG TPA: M23 family metallopeptidase [Pyrinomonadaceae bacterium]|nr:M23 family metallopeptidase [Pyrinomonadaceae bacterium]
MAAQTVARARLRVLVLVVIVFALLAIFLWALQRRRHNDLGTINKEAEHATSSVRGSTASPGVLPSPSPTASVSESPPNSPQPEAQPPTDLRLANSYVGTIKLIIPVTGVRADQLIDTFADARSEGRVHDAIDIPAPAGTPVLAAADGEIIKLFQSERGGTTIYQASVDRKLMFYYAHLQRYADGLAAGQFVKQGQIIAYVGDTGNAGTGNFHLHFSIAVVADAKRYWEGTNINPYPLLRN